MTSGCTATNWVTKRTTANSTWQSFAPEIVWSARCRVGVTVAGVVAVAVAETMTMTMAETMTMAVAETMIMPRAMTMPTAVAVAVAASKGRYFSNPPERT